MHGAGAAGAPPQGRVQVIRGLPLSAGAGEGVEGCAPRDQVNRGLPLSAGAGAGVAGAPPQEQMSCTPRGGGFILVPARGDEREGVYIL